MACSLVAFLDSEVYAGESLSLERAFGISEADVKHVNSIAGGQKAVNYGEVLPTSWLAVLDAVQPSRDDVFVDLGSGRGLLVMLTHLHCRLKRSIGVELSRERHAMALGALATLKSGSRAKDATGLAFVNEDVRTFDLSEATFVFLMNQDMPHKLIADVWRRLLELERPLTVVTLHPPKDVNLGGLQPEKTLRLPQTWNAAVDVHIYRLPGRTATSASKRPRDDEAVAAPAHARSSIVFVKNRRE